MKKLLKDMSARDMPDVESNHGKQQFYMQIAYSVLDSIETRKWNAQGSKINIDNNSVTMKITPNGIEVTTKDKDFEYFNVKNIDSEKKREEQRKELVIDIKEYITSYLNKNKKDSINKGGCMNKFKKMKKDSLDYDYDFMQVINAVYEQNYDGELGTYDLPRFPKTEKLIEEIWKEKYDDIDSLFDIPWTKEEKDKIFNSAKHEASLFDRIDIYNSGARYQTYDETRDVLKEIFGIDNKYLHDSKYNSIRDAMSTLIIYNPDFEVEDYVSGYDFWYEMHNDFLIVKGSKAKLLKLIKDLKLKEDDYEFENLKELKKRELNKTKKDSKQLTVEISTNDFDNNFTYEDDYEPDIDWLTKTYNISIDRHDHTTYITGEKSDLNKLFKDHHLHLE